MVIYIRVNIQTIKTKYHTSLIIPSPNNIFVYIYYLILFYTHLNNYIEYFKVLGKEILYPQINLTNNFHKLTRYA